MNTDTITKRLLRRLQNAPTVGAYERTFIELSNSIRELAELGHSSAAIHRALVAEGALSCSYRTFRRLSEKYLSI